MSNHIPPDESPLPLELRNQIVEHFISQRENLGTRIDSKCEIADKVAAQLDRTLISLSGGALIFSMTFVEKIAPAKLALWLLFASWLGFGTSMLAVMLSMRAQQQFFAREVKKFSQLYSILKDDEKEALKTGLVRNVVPGQIVESRHVAVFNLVALITFGFGVALLGSFVGYNLWKAS
jgi:hypothetical protein